MTQELKAEVLAQVKAAEKALRLARSLTPSESEEWASVRKAHETVHILQHSLQGD